MILPGRLLSRGISRRSSGLLPVLVIALVLAAWIPSSVSAMDVPQAGNTGIAWGPWITGTSSSGTIVHVKTGLPGNVTVRYGPEEEFLKTGTYRSAVMDNSSGLLHHIVLNELAPATRYHYQIVTTDGATGDCSFLTCPVSGPVTFIVYGDSRDISPRPDQNLRHSMVAESISRETNASFVLHTGDLLTESRDPEDWGRFFASGGIMLANTTFVPVLGNHEEDSPEWSGIFDTMPVYSFDCGNTHVTVIDSNDHIWNSIGCETAWLSEDLMTRQSQKFVALHHPLYSSDMKHPGGWINLRDAWKNILAEQNVTAVFQSHVHAYERDVSGGVTYITEGRGGSPFYLLNETRIAEHVASQQNSLGYTRVETDPARGTATFTVIQVAEYDDDGINLLSYTPEGAVLESFVLPVLASRNNSPFLLENASFQRGSLFLPAIATFHPPLFLSGSSSSVYETG